MSVESTKDLLEQVVCQELRNALSSESTTTDIGRAMEATDKFLEFVKVEQAGTKNDDEIELKKQIAENDYLKAQEEIKIKNSELDLRRKELENTFIHNDLEMKFKKRSRIVDTVVKVGEITAIVVAAPLIEKGIKKSLTAMVMAFEKDGYIATTSVGRTILNGLIKFKK